MKKIIAIFSVLILITLSGCDDECINCLPKSACDSLDEIRETAANSECLAEDFITGFGCSNTFYNANNPRISVGDRNLCTVIDCETLSCEGMRVESGPPEPGVVEQLSIDEMTGLPIGVFVVDIFQSEFTTTIVVP